MSVEVRAPFERILESLRTPFTIEGSRMVVGASIGVARGSRERRIADGAPVSALDSLIRDADFAMYRAKAQGKGRYTLFEPGMLALESDAGALVGQL